jgi:hypothetical protein
MSSNASAEIAQTKQTSTQIKITFLMAVYSPLISCCGPKPQNPQASKTGSHTGTQASSSDQETRSRKYTIGKPGDCQPTCKLLGWNVHNGNQTRRYLLAE